MWGGPGGVVDQRKSATRRVGYDLRVTDGAIAIAAHMVAAGNGMMTPREVLHCLAPQSVVLSYVRYSRVNRHLIRLLSHQMI